MIIRNDDVAFDTNFSEIQQFCEICDKYGIKVIQAIMPFGEAKKIKAKLTNAQIKAMSSKPFCENPLVVDYLRHRQDLIGVHGLWHTHVPSVADIQTAKTVLQELGLNPTYFVPPFNEGDYPAEVAGLTTCKLSEANGERLEVFLAHGTPTAKIMYLHSWRFDHAWYTFDQLDRCLQRLSQIYD